MKRRFTPIRINVIVLMTLGYGIIALIFLSLALGDNDLSFSDAYNVVEGPLMALIGGSLAISKDLIPAGDDSHPPSNDASEDNDRR